MPLPALMTGPLAPVALVTLLAACQLPATTRGVPGSSTADSLSIRRDIAHLSSDLLEGRGTGTPGNDSAAAYIARRYAALGLRPLGGDAASPYLQRFSARSVMAAHAGMPSSLPTQNVVAMLPGTDPALRGQYVVVGAHFDHLGRSPFSSQDPEARDAIRNGADDNASGTAAVMELARLLARRPAKRSILFVNFSGEELGLLGSQHFVEHAPVPLDSMVAMLNFDMVGRLRADTLIVYGTATAAEMPVVVEGANVAPQRLALRTVGDGFGPSDHSSFYGKNVPVLHFFTNTHESYHRASDDIETINAGGTARIVDYAERIARDLADRPARLTFQRAAAPRTVSRSSGVYFGSIPDMAAGDEPGVKISGVSPGGPAEKAGLQAGDVIVEFGGRPVKDLYEYTDALNAFKAGDAVKVVVLRKGQRVETTATLTARPGR